MKKLLTLCLLFCSGCSSYKHTIDFNPTEPIRVAVLPFAQFDKNGMVTEIDPSLLIDNVALVSSKLKETPAQYVQKLVHSELSETGLDLVPPRLVSAELVHNGFQNPDRSINLPKVFAASPKELCERLLNCDAVLYGKIVKWERDYFALQTVNTVGIELKLISARDNKVLFSANASDTETRGLSKGPTGYSDLVLEPLKGLSNDIIINLAATEVRKMLQPLRIENRPELLNTSPPAIFASAHDAYDGTVHRDEPLTILVYGTSGKTGSFSIGPKIENVPLTETDEGHYIGEYYPLTSDKFNDLPVSVSLTDQFGRMTKQLIGRGNVTLR